MPPLQPVVGRAPLYARDPATGDVYEVGGAGASEVAISSIDPYNASANATEELWLDTSSNPPILKGRVSGQWVIVSSEPPDPEVIVGGNIPAPGEDKLWLDPGGVMSPPTPGDPIKAMWAFDGSTGPTAGWHKVEVGGGSEVEVSDVDPITLNPDYELWVDSAPAPTPIPADEVWVGIDDPRVAFPGSAHELWQDTSLTPPVLKAWDGTAWVAVTGAYLPLAGGTMASNAIIQFPNEAAPTTKIVLYGTPASGFGHGVEGGNLTSFGSGFKFRQSSMTGTEFASIDSNGVVSKGVRVPTGLQVDNLAITSGSWYLIAHGVRPGGFRWIFSAMVTNSSALQTAMGTGSIRQAADSLVYSDVSLNGQTVSSGGKVFNRVSFGFSSGNYGLYARAAMTATVHVGVEVSNILNVDPAVVRPFTLSTVSPFYNGVDL